MVRKVHPLNVPSDHAANAERTSPVVKNPPPDAVASTLNRRAEFSALLPRIADPLSGSRKSDMTFFDPSHPFEGESHSPRTIGNLSSIGFSGMISTPNQTGKFGRTFSFDPGLRGESPSVDERDPAQDKSRQIRRLIESNSFTHFRRSNPLPASGTSPTSVENITPLEEFLTEEVPLQQVSLSEVHPEAATGDEVMTLDDAYALMEALKKQP